MSEDDGKRFGDKELCKFHDDYMLNRQKDLDHYVLNRQKDQAEHEAIMVKLNRLDDNTEDMIKAWNGIVVLSKFLTWLAGIVGLAAIANYFKH